MSQKEIRTMTYLCIDTLLTEYYYTIRYILKDIYLIYNVLDPDIEAEIMFLCLNAFISELTAKNKQCKSIGFEQVSICFFTFGSPTSEKAVVRHVRSRVKLKLKKG